MLAVMDASGKSHMERKTMQVSVRAEDWWIEQIDQWRKGAEGLPSRPEAIRRIVVAALSKLSWEEIEEIPK